MWCSAKSRIESSTGVCRRALGNGVASESCDQCRDWDEERAVDPVVDREGLESAEDRDRVEGDDALRHVNVDQVITSFVRLS